MQDNACKNVEVTSLLNRAGTAYVGADILTIADEDLEWQWSRAVRLAIHDAEKLCHDGEDDFVIRMRPAIPMTDAEHLHDLRCSHLGVRGLNVC